MDTRELALCTSPQNNSSATSWWSEDAINQKTRVSVIWDFYFLLTLFFCNSLVKFRWKKKTQFTTHSNWKFLLFIIILLCFNRQKVQLLSDVSVAVLLNCHMLWSSRCTLRCFQAVLGAYTQNSSPRWCPNRNRSFWHGRVATILTMTKLS